MSQRWSQVTFLHWRISAEAVEKHMPEGCTPDIIDGSAWVGLIAFQMSRSAFFGGPCIPWLGDFPEVNVRLYSVDRFGRRGVVFLSLEASHLIPVLLARAAFGLKYQWASMKIREADHKISYTTHRHLKPKARSLISVRPLEPDTSSEQHYHSQIALGLTAQWAFHQRHLGRTLYCRNSHEPWPLQPAELLYLDDSLLAIAGFKDLAERTPDSVLYAKSVNTIFASPSSVTKCKNF